MSGVFGSCIASIKRLCKKPEKKKKRGKKTDAKDQEAEELKKF